jgi:hypothetical protein
LEGVGGVEGLGEEEETETGEREVGGGGVFDFKLVCGV